VSAELDRYLTDSYRRDVMGESVKIETPKIDPKLGEEIEREIARIDALRLGANLANRDFVAYQNRRALLRLLSQLKANLLRSQERSQDAT
jgi:hypothetical protein